MYLMAYRWIFIFSNASMSFSPETLKGFSSEDISFLCSSYRNGVFRTISTLVPHLNYSLFFFLGVLRFIFQDKTGSHLHVKTSRFNMIMHIYIIYKQNIDRNWRQTWMVWFLSRGWSKAGWLVIGTQSIISPSSLCKKD